MNSKVRSNNSKTKISLLRLLGLGGVLIALGFLLGWLIKPSGKDIPENPEVMEEHMDDSHVWTCAMHPQVRQNESGQCPICGMDLIPLQEMKSDNPLIMEMTPEAVMLANIQTAEVGGSSPNRTNNIILTGRVKPDERLISSQVAHVPGRIEQLFITFTGDQITKGQKIISVYSPELVSAQRELIEAKKWEDTRPALLQAARNKLRYWKIPESTIEEIETSGQLHSNIDVFADQTGVVLKRLVAVGDHVNEGTVLFEVVDLTRLWLLFDAYEVDIAEIHLGDVIEYTVPSLPGRTFSSRISFIDPVINPQTRTAAIRTEVNNTHGLLKPEMLVKGTVSVRKGSGKEALTVPKTAVLWTGVRSVVYVEQPGASVPSYAFREVMLGDALGNEYIIEDGLERGERVVVNGAFAIDAAAQLNNMRSMMNRQVKHTGAHENIPDFTAFTSESFKNQLAEVLKSYLTLTDAFVQSDPAMVQNTVPAVTVALDRVNSSRLSGQEDQFWNEKSETIRSHLIQIRESTDIQFQRRQFSFLTNVFVELLTAFGTGREKTIYVIHCPMAFNNEGADWISEEETVRNPYFGEQMLTCGTIKGKLPLQDNITNQKNPNHLLNH